MKALTALVLVVLALAIIALSIKLLGFIFGNLIALAVGFATGWAVGRLTQDST